jgi:hypothetical protein
MGRTQRRLERVTKGLGKFVLAIERNIIEEVAKEVVVRTPVDTGYARGNWIPGINAPALSPVTTLDKSAVAAPSRINSVASFLRLGDTFYITNNAAYIGLLNAGYSPQAAANYITRAVSAGVKRGVARTRELRIR